MSATSDTFNHDVSKSNDFATSLVASLASTKSDTSSSTAVKSYVETDNIQGAVTIGDATATNIAVDGSTISTTATYGVTLADTAQQNAAGINIINAAGGMVAGGVNVAHSTMGSAIPTLTQTNAIVQSH
jgi:hypothetical protein